MSRLAAVAVSLALMAASVPCLAQETETSSATVGLTGIEVGSSAGGAILRARLQQAARQVCGTADTRDLSAMADMQACRASVRLQGAALLAARGQARPAPGGSKVASSDPRF